MTDHQASMFEFHQVGDIEIPRVPEPPTGPQGLPYSEASGTREAYQAWRATTEGQRAWRWIAEHALAAMERRERRVSPRTLVARCRDQLHARINDHFSAYIADDLVERWPALRPLVERRRRRKVS